MVFDSLNSASAIAEKDIRFPNLEQSLRKFGGAINLYYDYSDDIKVMLSGGTNQNIALQPLNSGAVLSNYTNLSQNLFLSAKVYDFSIQTSMLSGKQGLTGNQHVNEYNYSNNDIYVDYNYEVIEDKLSIRPALSYQSAYANGKEYTIDKGLNGTFNNEGKITNVAASLKIDAQPITKLRLIGAVRYDKFNYPEKGVMSYQGIANYKLNDQHIFRAVTGRSYNGSFLLPTLINNSNQLSPPSSFSPGMNLNLRGNKNLDLLNNTLYEIGYRSKIAENTSLDIAVFSQTFEGFSNLILHVPAYDFFTNTLNFNYYQENLKLIVKQKGATIALQSNLLGGKVQIRPNITIQQTEVENFTEYYNQKGAWNNPTFGYTLAENIDSTRNISSKSTPKFFGGFNLIVKPINKLTIDLSGYFYDGYVLHNGAEASFMTGEVENQKGSIIANKFTANLNIYYAVSSNLNAFVNLRNFTNQKSPEGFGTGQMAATYLIGITMNY